MPGMLLDLRQAWRLLWRQPAFSLWAVATLAIGIGAATAVFSLVHAVLLRDLPFAEPDRLAWLYNVRTERDRAPLSIPDLEEYRRENTTLAGLAVFTNWTANLTGGGDPERLEGVRVSGDFLPLVGARPALGRTLEPRDEQGDRRAAVVTHGLWTRRFGGDPAMVGTRITLNGAAHTVVGVMPAGFVFPFRDAEIAVPFSLADDPRRGDRGANFLRTVARLKRGVTFAAAKADLDTIAHRLQREYPRDDARKTGVSVYPLHAEIVRDYQRILWTLFAAVGVLLAIGCGNLANLLLVRAIGRQAELGVRVSLGASPRRIMRQLAAEAAVVAVAGAVLGVFVAQAAIDGWRTFGPANFPRLAAVGIDIGVLGFAAAVCAAVVVVCGILPGWLVSRDLAAALRSTTRAQTSSRRDGLLRRGFVVVQIGGAAILLVCTALVARGLARLERVDPGFTADHALTVQLSLPPARYATREAITAVYEALALPLGALNGVTAAGVVSLLPLSGLLSTIDVAFPDRPAPPPEEVPQAHFRIASPGYFAAAGIAVLDGREFTARDDVGGQPVALISRALADRHWPGQRAVGRFLRLAEPATSPMLEVVGVVKDVKQFTLDGAPTPDLYVPVAQMPASQAPALASRMYWVIRTDDEPAALISEVRRTVHATDPDVATSSARTLDAVLALSLGGRRANVRLLEVFGQVSVLLAAIGVYAVAAFAAGARRRELAIRSAFGASRRDLVRLMLAGELRPVLMGIGGGLGCALIVTRSLGDALFEISPMDGTTYASVAGALAAVTLAASCLPALRAGRVDPAELLRS